MPSRRRSSMSTTGRDHLTDYRAMFASIEHRHIELLAYTYWQERGRPLDSPEVDWFRALQTLRVERGFDDLPLAAFYTIPSG